MSDKQMVHGKECFDKHATSDGFLTFDAFLLSLKDLGFINSEIASNNPRPQELNERNVARITLSSPLTEEYHCTESCPEESKPKASFAIHGVQIVEDL